MSAHVWVIASDLRRQQIKVQPTTFLSDIHDQACAKWQLDSAKYTLKRGGTGLDLALAFRHSQLVSGAKLDLVVKSRTAAAVTVALQLPQPEAKTVPGGRLIHKFPSTMTIWQILRQMESGEASAGHNLNFTARGVARRRDHNAGSACGSSVGSAAGDLFYEKPVLHILQRELKDFSDFQKTLDQLGFQSGNVLMRLTFKVTDTPLAQAKLEIDQYFQPKRLENDPQQDTQNITKAEDTQKDTQTEDTQTTNAHKEEARTEEAPEDTHMEQENLPLASANHVHGVQEPQSQPNTTALSPILPTTEDRVPAPQNHAPLQNVTNEPVAIFAAPAPGKLPGTVVTAQTSRGDDGDDDDPDQLVPSISHAKAHQAALAKLSQNKRLPSDREIAEQAAAHEAKLQQASSLTVRVRFPDNSAAQWSLEPSATGAMIYARVRDVMAHPEQPFRLVFPVDRLVLPDNPDAQENQQQQQSLIRQFHLTQTRIVVNVVWDDVVPVAVRSRPFLKATTAALAKPPPAGTLPPADDVVDGGDDEERSRSEKLKDATKNLGKKMPKWLKLPGKK